VREALCPECGRDLVEGARFCAFCGFAVEAEREERKVVTALFADVVGSTQLGERLDPEDFRSVVGGAIAVMGEAVEELGGRVRGSAGDAVLGLFGAPDAREDDPERAVLAGLRVVERMRAYGAEAAREWSIGELSVRVGIETGLAVLGAVRAGRQVQYDASGDSLNTAARLQAQADPGTVLVGPLTQRLTEPLFDWDETRQLELKGKAERVGARVALRARPAARRRDAAASTSRLFGRDRELAVLEEAAAEASAGSGAIAVLSGEAGIGKTRLIAELRSLLAECEAGKPWLWLEGHGVSYAADQPYLPVRQVLAGALETVGGGADVRSGIAMLLGEERADELAPLLLSIFGASLEEEEVDRLSSLSQEMLQHRVVEAVHAVLDGLSEDAPLAVVLDDLHWADAATIRIASGVAALAASRPILIVLAMRPEEQHASWALRNYVLAEHGAREMTLASLPSEAERSLVADLIGEGTLPEKLEQRLLGRAEGNPFYLEELIRSLLDAGVLVKDGGAWALDSDAPFDLPETVERVVLARIDRLDPPSRELLSAASVLGRQFELPLLRWIARERDVSDSVLTDLQGLGLIVEETPGVEYRFKHPLIQEAAYNSLLRSRRTEMHGRAAAAIENINEEIGEALYPVLARHHNAAANLEPAARYHRLAGESAQRVFAVEEALRHFDAAVLCAERMPPAAASRVLPELYHLRGNARARLGDFSGGGADLRAALAGARAVHDVALEGRALNDLGWLVRGHGYEEAIDHHERALRAAEQIGDDRTQVTALSRLSLLYSNRLQLDRALDLSRRGLEIARRLGDDSTMGSALDAVKLAALQLGDLELLERTTREIVEVHERTGDLYFAQWGHIEGASVPLARGDHEEALARLDEAAALNRELSGDEMAGAIILESRSWVERSRGDGERALAAIREATDVGLATEMPEWMAWVLATQGSHLLEFAGAREAIPSLERALELAGDVHSPNRALRAASHLALAYCQTGEIELGREAAKRAQEILDAVTTPPGGAFLNGYHSYLALARAWLALGEPELSEAVIGPALDAARRAGWVGAEAALSAVSLGVGAGER
jgi:predicted ATPase/class 3 adenylate cyclase